MNLLTKIIQKADSLVGYPLNRLRYGFCKLSGRPYLGPLYAAAQGIPARYEHMRDLILDMGLKRGIEINNILEIGSWSGGSARVWAEALKSFNRCKGTIHCVDPWIEYFDPQSRNPIHRAMNKACRNRTILSLFLHNTHAYWSIIVAHVGRSDQVLPTFKEQAFDLVYIDGDHSFRAVYSDLDLSAPLLKDGGILCGDDLELQWDEADTLEAAACKNEDYMLDHKTGQYYHPGVTLAVHEFFGRRVSAKDGFWAVRKRGKEWEDVTW